MFTKIIPQFYRQIFFFFFTCSIYENDTSILQAELMNGGARPKMPKFQKAASVATEAEFTMGSKKNKEKLQSIQQVNITIIFPLLLI